MSVSYLLRRLLGVVPAVGAILLVTFVVVHLIPGDPALVLAGEAADPARVAEVRQQYGLDRPLPAQLLTYAGNMLRGDLGFSYSYGTPVTEVIAHRMWPTLLLAGTALFFSSAVAILFGAVSSRRPYGRLDFAVNIGVLLGYALPGFWLAQIAILVLSIHLGWFPVGGMQDVRIDYTGFAHWRDVAHHLILPALVLAVSELALLSRVTRSGIIDQMDSDYARMARAKGLSEWDVLSRHALLNALLPVVTIVGGRIGMLLSGAVIIENIFSWPGLGTLVVEAARNADRPLMLGMVLVVATGVAFANLMTDLAYAAVDPRIRHR